MLVFFSDKEPLCLAAATYFNGDRIEIGGENELFTVVAAMQAARSMAAASQKTSFYSHETLLPQRRLARALKSGKRQILNELSYPFSSYTLSS